MRAKTRDDLGLAITMLDSDRLRQWADKIDTHGDDISADRRFVSEQLRAVAGRIEATVREVGTLREMAGIHPAEPTPPADRPETLEEQLREQAAKGNGDLYAEAADTIAALRAELAEARKERDAAHAHACENSLEERGLRAELAKVAGCDGNCSCAIGSRHSWLVAYSDTRVKLEAAEAALASARAELETEKKRSLKRGNY